MITIIKRASLGTLGTLWLGGILLGAAPQHETYPIQQSSELFRDHPLVGEFY